MTTAVATQEQKPPTLAQLIEQMKPEIGRALPKHLSPDRMSIALVRADGADVVALRVVERKVA